MKRASGEGSVLSEAKDWRCDEGGHEENVLSEINTLDGRRILICHPPGFSIKEVIARLPDGTDETSER